MTRLTESSLLNIKNKSFQVTAQLVVPDDGARGTIIAQGGSFGGWGLMMHEGAARFAYNLLGVNVFLTDAERPVPAGEHQVRVEFAYDGGGLAKGGTVTLYYDGEKVGEGKIALTEPMLFTATETAWGMRAISLAAVDVLEGASRELHRKDSQRRGPSAEEELRRLGLH
jgi:hypothetical protein